MNDDTSATTSPEKSLLLNNSRQAILKWARSHFSEFVNRLSDKIFQLAEQADNNDTQTRLFQVRQQLEQNHSALEQLFSEALGTAFDNYNLGQPTHCDHSESQQAHNTLSLVDNNELEQSLAIAAMARKASAEYIDQLLNLNRRLTALRGSTLTEHGNPIAPGVFAEAMQHAFKSQQLDAKSRLIVFKIFDSAFMPKLGGLYQLLNQHFGEHGILPNLNDTPPPKQKSKGRDKPKQTEPVAAPAEPSQLPDELLSQQDPVSLHKQIELFQMINALQQQLQQVLPTPAIPPELLQPATQVIDTLQQLQRHSGQQLSQLEGPQQVFDSGNAGLQREVEQEVRRAEDIDQHVIEIVGLLFEYMLNDEQLPDSVKSLLSYLHTPFLKVAICDKDFFDHPQHPARQLLNSLVAAGGRWVEPQGRHRNEVFLQIKAVVERILKEFDNDLKLFSQLAFDFNHYLRQHSRRIKLAEKRTMQAAQGENKLKEIRLRVASFIDKKIGNIELPETILKLLHEPWANFLSFNLLRFGSHSEQWLQAANTVDDILWYVQITHYSSHPENFQRFQSLQKALPQTLQQGFDTVGYDSVQAAGMLAALEEINQQSEPSTVSHSTATPTAINADIDDLEIRQPLPADVYQDKYIQQLLNTEFGSWFLLNADQNKSLQHLVKLAWSNTNTLHFMFVNRLGQQVAMKEGVDLAEQLHQGKIKIIGQQDERPFFETSLERILTQLQLKRPKNSD